MLLTVDTCTAVLRRPYFCMEPQRKIGKQLRKIDESPEDGREGESVSGQVGVEVFAALYLSTPT